MSIVSVIVSDLNMTTGDFDLNFSVSNDAISDGRATAAYFTAFYVSTLIHQPEFIAAASMYGDALKAAMQEDGPRPETLFPAEVTINLTDRDLAAGTYSITTSVEGGDPTRESLPTAAQIVAGYIRSLLHRVDFRDACWAFAEEFVQNNTGASIGNNDSSPANLINPDNNGAASLAA
jgi:hypothetical protein